VDIDCCTALGTPAGPNICRQAQRPVGASETVRIRTTGRASGHNPWSYQPSGGLVCGRRGGPSRIRAVRPEAERGTVACKLPTEVKAPAAVSWAHARVALRQRWGLRRQATLGAPRHADRRSCLMGSSAGRTQPCGPAAPLTGETRPRYIGSWRWRRTKGGTS
jgi:hypothetical protein